MKRRIYEIQPPLEDAVFLRVDCGQPQCGMPSDRFADQRLDQTFPFSVSGRQLPAGLVTKSNISGFLFVETH